MRYRRGREMISLIGGFIGLLTALVPQILKFLERWQDHRHQLELMDRQAEIQRINGQLYLDEAIVHAESSNYAEAQRSEQSLKSGIKWVEAIRALVRPIITYAFFALYAASKYASYTIMITNGVLWNDAVMGLWNMEDMGLFSIIICFWFGGRAIQQRHMRPVGGGRDAGF
jgi:hypothetical protein